jgi:hypothetical protein
VVGAAAPVEAVVNNRGGGFRLLEAFIITWRMVWCMCERQGSVLAEMKWVAELKLGGAQERKEGPRSSRLYLQVCGRVLHTGSDPRRSLICPGGKTNPYSSNPGHRSPGQRTKLGRIDATRWEGDVRDIKNLAVRVPRQRRGPVRLCSPS